MKTLNIHTVKKLWRGKEESSAGEEAWPQVQLHVATSWNYKDHRTRGSVTGYSSTRDLRAFKARHRDKRKAKRGATGYGEQSEAEEKLERLNNDIVAQRHWWGRRHLVGMARGCKDFDESRSHPQSARVGKKKSCSKPELLWFIPASLHCCSRRFKRAGKITPNKGGTSAKLTSLRTHQHPGRARLRKPRFTHTEARPEQILTSEHTKCLQLSSADAHLQNGMITGCDGNWPAFTHSFSWKALKCFALRQNNQAPVAMSRFKQCLHRQGPSSLRTTCTEGKPWKASARSPQVLASGGNYRNLTLEVQKAKKKLFLIQ